MREQAPADATLATLEIAASFSSPPTAGSDCTASSIRFSSVGHGTQGRVREGPRRLRPVCITRMVLESCAASGSYKYPSSRYCSAGYRCPTFGTTCRSCDGTNGTSVCSSSFRHPPVSERGPTVGQYPECPKSVGPIGAPRAAAATCVGTEPIAYPYTRLCLGPTRKITQRLVLCAGSSHRPRSRRSLRRCCC